MTTTSVYDIGDQPTLVATFVDSAGVPADPTGITFKVMDPDGVVTTEDETDATNPATGTWHWTLPAAFDQDGNWKVRAAATAGLICAVETTIRVRDSFFD